MGARSYSKHRPQVSSSSSIPMEANYINPNNPNVDQNTPLSGAYIRNLVKQLTTNCNSSSSSSSSPPPTPTKKPHQKSQSNNTTAPHKKQVRRRLHTTKPYQERLLNMAEARKEIVTALKFHRASMKQQQQQQQQQQHQQQQEQEEILMSSSQQHFQETNFFSSPPQALVLPNQTLGLSLSSFQDLTSLDAACLYTDDAASSALSPLSVLPDPATGGDATLMSFNADPSQVKTELQFGGDQQELGLVGSRAVGDLEMEEMKSIGEMHEMEWNDKINLANSAWWFKFLKSMEFEQQLDNSSPNDDRQFEQVVEFPLCWEGGYDPTHFITPDGNFYPDFELPCMNIEDIERQGEEWLS